MNSQIDTKKITIISFLTTIAIVLSIFEATLPILPSIPGGKLGLVNIVVIIIIYKYGNKTALCVNVVRALLVCLIHSGANSLPYSVVAAVISTLSMIHINKLLKTKVSPVGVSVTGAFFHNLSQVCVASLMLKSASVFSYFSLLTFISIISGIVTGITAKMFINLNFGGK